MTGSTVFLLLTYMGVVGVRTSTIVAVPFDISRDTHSTAQHTHAQHHLSYAHPITTFAIAIHFTIK